MGYSVITADTNDGYDDLVVGAPFDARAGDLAGAAIIYFGPLATGTLYPTAPTSS